jgi:hypothetical protein
MDPTVTERDAGAMFARVGSPPRSSPPSPRAPDSVRHEQQIGSFADWHAGVGRPSRQGATRRERRFVVHRPVPGARRRSSRRYCVPVPISSAGCAGRPECAVPTPPTGIAIGKRRHDRRHRESVGVIAVR